MGTVLLGESVADLRLTFGMAIRRASHNVITACNIDQVVALARRVLFDVIVLNLSDGLGLEACRRLRAGTVNASTPVLLLSADVHPNAAEAARAGAAHYMTKPVAIVQLLACVEELMARRPRGGTSAAAVALSPRRY